MALRQTLNTAFAVIWLAVAVSAAGMELPDESDVPEASANMIAAAGQTVGRRLAQRRHCCGRRTCSRLDS